MGPTPAVVLVDAQPAEMVSTIDWASVRIWPVSGAEPASEEPISWPSSLRM